MPLVDGSRRAMTSSMSTRVAAAFGALASAILAIPTLVYPFGPDQALYYYVGREWWLRGSVPYRDVFDHKTPFIYALHAVLVGLTGENQWALRAAEVMVCLAVAVAVASYGGRWRKESGWRFFVALLLTNGLYFGFFDYWTTGQTEIWCVGATAWALHRARRGKAVQAGLLLGISFIAKPPSLVFVAPVALLFLLRRTIRLRPTYLRYGARGMASLLLGLAVPLALVGAYLFVSRALSPMLDIVVGANSYYVKHDARVANLHEYLQILKEPLGRFRGFLVVVVVMVVSSFVLTRYATGRLARARRFVLLRDLVVGVVWLLAAVAAVSVQRKFFWLHWGLLVGPLAFLLTRTSASLFDLAQRARGWIPGLTLAATALAIAAPHDYTWDYWKFRTFRATKFALGTISRGEYYHDFHADVTYFYLPDSLEVAEYVRTHASTGDRLLARGFQPQLYSLTGLYYGGRFYWSNFLSDAARAYRREEYLREDEGAFFAIQPRWAVVLNSGIGVESPDWFLSRGCSSEKVFSKFTVLNCSRVRPTQ
jgi:4-amino-4-deoxy-L-arabinose transferase-like glycosyltransferase